MEYTKESLKMWWEPTMYLPWLQPYLIKFADAWAQEVAELEMDKAELRELCRLKDREAASFDDEPLLPDSDYDRMGELWAKHMKGGEG